MDGQKQKVGENGVALQAGGDISVGMSYTEVKDNVTPSSPSKYGENRGP